jgi:hypothetical protein
MDQIPPQHIPVYEGDRERRQLWEAHQHRNQPVVAIRNGRRGYIVRYDLQHLGNELAPSALERLRQQTRDWRMYPTADGRPGTVDPISAAEGVGGEAGPISGDFHTDTESRARDLASRLSAIVLNRDSWH